jgi:elongator complex protein 5
MTYIAGSQASTPEDLLKEIKQAMENFKENLVIIDNLYDLVHVKGVDMNVLFDLVAMQYASTLLGVYHQDILPQVTPGQEYNPEPIKLFDYLATTVIRCVSFAQALAIKAAKERSLPEPTHGLLMGAEGIVQCLKADDIRGIVLEAEFRRKSGRPESETYFLPPSRAGADGEYNAPQPGMHVGTLKEEFVKLIAELPEYTDSGLNEWLNNKGNAIDNEIETRATFKLSLTDKEKTAREGVVLPYHDAQNQQGESGEGGRILYDMGAEDDFDEEEDEI